MLHDVTVEFNKTAYNNGDLFIRWIEKEIEASDSWQRRYSPRHCNGSGMLLPVQDVTHLQGLISWIQTMRKETTI